MGEGTRQSCIILDMSIIPCTTPELFNISALEKNYILNIIGGEEEEKILAALK